jgi:hypothetical protein
MLFITGKINQNESELNCAVREVMEEIGFDVKDLIRENDYIEHVLRGEQRNRLYIIPGVSEETQFCPQTRKEISVGRNIRITIVPIWNRMIVVNRTSNGTGSRIYRVTNDLTATSIIPAQSTTWFGVSWGIIFSDCPLMAFLILFPNFY